MHQNLTLVLVFLLSFFLFEMFFWLYSGLPHEWLRTDTLDRSHMSSTCIPTFMNRILLSSVKATFKVMLLKYQWSKNLQFGQKVGKCELFLATSKVYKMTLIKLCVTKPPTTVRPPTTNNWPHTHRKVVHQPHTTDHQLKDRSFINPLTNDHRLTDSTNHQPADSRNFF